jgi:hypothetical protein
MTHHLSNKGNVDDIRASLQFGGYTITDLIEEIGYEVQNKNRKTVINLYKSHIKKLSNANKQGK